MAITILLGDAFVVVVTARCIGIAPITRWRASFHTLLRKGLKSSIPHWTLEGRGRKCSKEISFLRRKRVTSSISWFSPLISRRPRRNQGSSAFSLNRSHAAAVLTLYPPCPSFPRSSGLTAIIPSCTAITFFPSVSAHRAAKAL